MIAAMIKIIRKAYFRVRRMNAGERMPILHKKKIKTGNSKTTPIPKVILVIVLIYESSCH